MNLLIFFGAIVLVLIIVIIIVFNLPQFGKLPDYKLNEKIINSKQFYNKTFHNLYLSGKMKLNGKKLIKLFKSFVKSKAEKRPPKQIVLCSANQIWKEENLKKGNFITWFGHSSIMLDINGTRILIDPVFGKYASPFRGAVKRFNNSIHFSDDDFFKFGKIDAVIISHDHFDHLDYYTIKKIKNSVSEFFVPLGVGNHLLRWGIDRNKIKELDWWEETKFKNLELVCTPSQHFGGRNPFRQNSTLWCSWVIRTGDLNLFFSGDSGYFKGFKEIGKKYGPFNLAMLECGQYNELWHEIHMMPEETAWAGIDLDAELILPIHNSVFSLSVHNWDEPLKRLYAVTENKSVEIIKILQGDSFEL